jgi:hypothetical protein
MDITEKSEEKGLESRGLEAWQTDEIEGLLASYSVGGGSPGGEWGMWGWWSSE